LDKKRAKAAVKELLLALDCDVNAESFKDTPKRVAEMFVEQCTERKAELERCFEEKKFDGMVAIRDIPFESCCQHHMVFYSGRAHIAYVPKGEKVLGLSKLARLVYSCSVGLTTQESVTQAVADRLYKEVDTLGCMVVLEAEHGCVSLRGARAVGSSTVTSVVKGVFRDVPAARSEFQAFLTKGSHK
jgi:GTP cyclohydrolase I